MEVYVVNYRISKDDEYTVYGVYRNLKDARLAIENYAPGTIVKNFEHEYEDEWYYDIFVTRTSSLLNFTIVQTYVR